MNPLTQIKNTIKATAREHDLGLGEDASWHARFKHSAYIFAGGLDFALTEGDILAVFAQYGEIVDINLARDKATGKTKGFAFLAYDDQRSTVLAVDNLNGATVAGRKVRVEHVDNYKKRKAQVGAGTHL
ncbi:RNA-binding motif protein, X-linked 2 [Monoraphidium neglectum]|uniref:RNA-binding motif protein, X-linked 2 n=1 Tax=Monoraphidium neglectum TaxID=145388 RepID=A0A0D2J9P4_9CHLO|nr:RNA-binding motif protein, X-linked 2 [Monoraphidium neglectum]KIY96477.1 RNA-binding motif protein, X-linked 2 [Monoraphidium neglectum]|eukprot:XP_013895497.1 RNA-binding motif protein, X-linked 2 [Monoraphidium neglectum]